jgi:hypothetical protein
MVGLPSGAAPLVPLTTTIPSEDPAPPAADATPAPTPPAPVDGAPLVDDEPEIEVSGPSEAPAATDGEPERRGWISSLLGRLSRSDKTKR